MLTSLTIVALLVGGQAFQNIQKGVPHYPVIFDRVEKEPEECQLPNFEDFPQTKEELDRECRIGISYMRCLRKVLKWCNDPEEDTWYLAQLFFYVETVICNEDSPMYEILTNNIKCIKEAHKVTRETCPAYSRKVLDDNLHIYGQYKEQKWMCVESLFYFACSAAVFANSCGESVAMAFSDIVLKVDPTLIDCPSEITRPFYYLKQVMGSPGEAKEETRRKRRR